MANIFILPFEIMFSIFQYLPYQDPMTIVLVCKEWRKVGTDSILWKNFSLVKKDHCLESIGNILGKGTQIHLVIISTKNEET